MARYIDADALENYLELSIKSWGRDCNSNAPKMVAAYQEILYRVKYMSTADVAPRAEVERLQSILDSYAVQYGTVKDQREVMDRIKKETAREIFEEIEREKLFVRDRIGNMRAVVLFEAIAELKKKYTEDGK